MRWTQLGVYFLVMALSQLAFAQDFVPGEVIVKLRNPGRAADNKAFLGKVQKERGMALRNSFGKMNMHNMAIKPGDDVQAVINQLQQDPDVEYAEPNYYLKKTSLDEARDVMTFSQMEQAYAQNSGSFVTAQNQINSAGDCASIPAGTRMRPVVAVIDTGLDANHAVFQATDAVWRNPNEIPGNGIDDDGNGYVDDVNGWNFVANNGAMIDDDYPGHGTHVAGIVLSVCQSMAAGTTAKSKIQVMPLKFLDGSGVGKTSDAIKAIYYAVNNGATVLNNSWGGANYSGALHEAIVYSYERGVAFVAAAGNAANNNDYQPMYPASYSVPNVIAVAAVNPYDALASFSNFGLGSVHIGSPGDDIYSTLPDSRYGRMSGTSMAAPYVSGALGMILFDQPSMLAYQMKQIVFSTAEFREGLRNKVFTSSRLTVQEAIDVANNSTVDLNQPNYSFQNQDRSLASSLAGGGCGLVTKLVKDHNDRQGPQAPHGPSSWYVLFLLAVLSLPILVYNFLRTRDPVKRRRHERFKISSEVVVAMGDRQLVGSISSISLGGVQLNTDALLEHGGVVAMTISGPNGKDQIQVEGKVVWSEANRSYGVQFANAKSPTLEKIATWTKSLTKA